MLEVLTDDVIRDEFAEDESGFKEELPDILSFADDNVFSEASSELIPAEDMPSFPLTIIPDLFDEISLDELLFVQPKNEITIHSIKAIIRFFTLIFKTPF